MLRRISTALATVGTIGLVAAYSAHAAPVSAAAVRAVAPDTVTGCLGKGDKKDVYSVTDASGKKHWVTSTSVSLAGHVGHTVMLVGSAPADNKMGSDTSMKMSGGMSMGPMNVTSMSMVSGSCK
jgi:hypothetical protein